VSSCGQVRAHKVHSAAELRELIAASLGIDRHPTPIRHRSDTDLTQ